MEDILDVYEMPYNPQIPAVCMDEKPYQILDNRLEPLPMRCGDIQKTDSEYIRKGTFTRIFITHIFPGRNFFPDGFQIHEPASETLACHGIQPDLCDMKFTTLSFFFSAKNDAIVGDHPPNK